MTAVYDTMLMCYCRKCVGRLLLTRSWSETAVHIVIAAVQGFLHLKMKPVLRRLLTRGLAVVPAVIVAAVMGDKAVGQLLVISQVILSMQLSFAVFPLVQFTSMKKYAGRYANSTFTSIVAVLVALLIAGLNAYLLIAVMRDPTSMTH